MTDSPIISGTIVLYKNDLAVLQKAVESFLNIPLAKVLYLVDNSPTDELRNAFPHADIEYIFVGKNSGFGSAQNKVIKEIENTSSYHLVLNPDVKFTNEVVPHLIEVLKKEPTVTMIAPKVLYNNGNHQYSCRRYPSLIELLGRRIDLLGRLIKKQIAKANYADQDLSIPFYVEYLTGCFQLYKTKDFVKINGFDERYFLYMEDIDICRKIDRIHKKKLYYPLETIYHTLERGSSKKIKLFLHHSFSVFQYFYKWGVKNKKATKRND